MGMDSLDGLAARVETLEGQVKEIFERLNDKDNSPSVLAAKLNSMLVTLGEVKQAVNDLKSRPGRWWDNLIGYGLAAVIATLVGLLFAHIH